MYSERQQWQHSTLWFSSQSLDYFISSELKGVITRSMLDALSKLCSPFLEGGNSAFIAAIVSGLFHKPNIGHSNNYSPNRNKMGSNY